MAANYTKTIKQDPKRGRVVVYERKGPAPRYNVGRGSDLARLVAAVRGLVQAVKQAKAQGRL